MDRARTSSFESRSEPLEIDDPPGSLESGGKIGRIDRPGQVGVGPGLEPLEDFGLPVPPGQHQDVDVAGKVAGTEGPAQLEAVHPGQTRVRNHDGEELPRHGGDGLAAVCYGHDLPVSRIREGFPQSLPVCGILHGDQDRYGLLFHHSGTHPRERETPGPHKRYSLFFIP